MIIHKRGRIGGVHHHMFVVGVIRQASACFRAPCRKCREAGPHEARVRPAARTNMQMNSINTIQNGYSACYELMNSLFVE